MINLVWLSSESLKYCGKCLKHLEGSTLFMINSKITRGLACLGLVLGAVPSVCANAGESPSVVAKSSQIETQKQEDFSAKYYDVLLKNESLSHEKFLLEAEIAKLKQDNIVLQSNADKYKRRMAHYKKKYESNKNNLSADQMQSEIERVRSQMILEFTSYLGEYIKTNPSKKVKNIDLRGLLNRLITLNVNYTNNGDTIISPLAAKGTAKATIAGAAIAS